MCRSKRFLQLLWLLPGLLGSCSPEITRLREAALWDPALYQSLLLDTCGARRRAPMRLNLITGITVYKTSFSEKLVEAGSVLRVASLNDNSSRDTVAYKGFSGARQDLYLVHLSAGCRPEYWVYFSVMYQPSNNLPIRMLQTGFGAAYLGVPDTINKTLHFTNALRIAAIDKEPGYQFRLKQKRAFFFVVKELKPTAATISVDQIVVEEKNKYGGPNAFVFNVSEHLPGDLRSLIFRRVGHVSLL